MGGRPQLPLQLCESWRCPGSLRSPASFKDLLDTETPTSTTCSKALPRRKTVLPKTCAYGVCTASECCQAAPTCTGFKDYSYNSRGKKVCTQSFPKAKSTDTKCTGTECNRYECCEGEKESSCFPAEATTIVSGSFATRMSELEVGTRVLVADASFESVIGFPHTITDPEPSPHADVFVERS